MNPIKRYKYQVCSFGIILFLFTNHSFGQNPFILDQFTADPSARVFGNRVYVYPSHDIPAVNGRGRVGWFCMEDYHVFSSSNLTEWTDHGVIVSQDKVQWVDSTSYSMWAPDCISRNGKYYFYFPTKAKDSLAYGRGFRIGVAVSDKPYGPFNPQTEPIKNVQGIDPNVFIDKDGHAYLYWSERNIYGARLKENMLELDTEPKILGDLPTKGLKEGPYLFERNGLYYLTYPHVENKTERLEYAIGNNPLGPFKFTGVLMDESSTGCWTNHHSIIQFKNQWYLFYHHNDLSPQFDKNRSVRVDSLFFNKDGTINKVVPTLRGVGLTNATGKVQIDRYSHISQRSSSVDFLDSLDKFKGWKVRLDSADAWVQYNSIDFGKKPLRYVAVKAISETGGILQIRLDSINGPLVAEVKITGGADWKLSKAPVIKFWPGVHNLFIVLKDNRRVEADWVRFE
ncbi:MAG: family 43 glycosylhydrolase [Chitinophagaceae bacterium]|nr:family 43 glycosylhydrolase [Chitinophagaceae bacterium]